MAFANLLLGADPSRERWVTTGASMVAIDTLVHNWLHRTRLVAPSQRRARVWTGVLWAGWLCQHH